jgi:hypothetical protein
MKTMAAIFLVLPFIILLSGTRLGNLLGEQGFVGVGVFASLVCLIWGFYIFPRYRLLAWCCLITATLLIVVFLGYAVSLNNIIQIEHEKL